MTALRKTTARPHLRMPLRSRSVRNEASDVAAREALLDACFGDNRHARTCQRLRDGRAPAEGLALSAVRRGPPGRHRAVVARQRRGHPGAHARPAGGGGILPPARRRAALMDHALAAAKARGHRAVILLGDAPYYARFGFSAAKTGELTLPGAFERDRLLGLEAARRRARRRLGHDRRDRRAACRNATAARLSSAAGGTRRAPQPRARCARPSRHATGLSVPGNPGLRTARSAPRGGCAHRGKSP